METDGFAPAKINLCLHVIGQRPDGYHLLDSLVVFADIGDRLQAAPSETMTLDLAGPFGADIPAGEDNLVMRAARAMDAVPMRITLEKHLPPASGIGGGSSDAAATLRLLARLTGRALPKPEQVLALGADVPACLLAAPLRLQGIGERLEPLRLGPPVWAVLANPRAEVSTPAVFRALTRKDNRPMPPRIPAFADARALALWLADQRNDLEAPAIAVLPSIAAVLSALSATGQCLLARMSGSGATCFGIYPDEAAAREAEADLRAQRPGWWIAACRFALS
ncbi:4-(cytidine 5'-diphospho)-2-C-methyl-D-erythritol kinase [Plastorhodobacter daqingensis]|uniref:4-diphosphocytidyl-2-C-methyl-D-erythritol kinase n=1 Tax=Plastorhodobacter daqingensis TaxID=1387281 RepID=A0ABW2UI66_9RHOB